MHPRVARDNPFGKARDLGWTARASLLKLRPALRRSLEVAGLTLGTEGAHDSAPNVRWTFAPPARAAGGANDVPRAPYGTTVA